jgi:hypothetical protein
MGRAVAVAVVELDAVRRGTAEKGGVEQVGATRASRHRDASGRAHPRDHGFSTARHIAGSARDHHADGVEQMPARVVAHLVGECAEAQRANEIDDGAGRPRGGRQLVNGFGV